MLKGHGKSARNARKGQNPEALEEQYKKSPHSLVIHRGEVGVNVRRLVKDTRRIMEPFTASSLKVYTHISLFLLLLCMQNYQKIGFLIACAIVINLD